MWKVEQRGLNWYVVHPKRQPKKVGPVKLRGVNYYDLAVKEAKRRNREFKEL